MTLLHHYRLIKAAELDLADADTLLISRSMGYIHTVCAKCIQVQYALWRMQYTVWRMQYTVCSMEDAVCNMQNGVCSMEYEVCSMEYEVCSMEDVVWSMQYGVQEHTGEYSVKHVRT